MNIKNICINRAYSLIELMIVMGVIGLLASIALPLYENYANGNSTIPMDIWKKEPTFIVDNNLNNLVEVEVQTGRYDHDMAWKEAVLSGDSYLINPTFRDSLCHFPMNPASNTDSKNASIPSISLSQLQSSTTHQLVVKRIPSSWLKANPDNQNVSNYSCPNVDISHEYLQYKGKDVVELVNIVDPTHESKFSHDQLVR